jgi:glyoxylase-like metal-dependent hydrolase (beta-lactamase superfamily II)
MIDSGLDKDQARRAINIAKELSLDIKSLLNTHSHADHIGGNRFVVDRLGIPVYADKHELPYITNPVLEAVTLYGGYPPKDFRNKFFIAKPVYASDIAELNPPFEAIDLSGHSPGMTGFQIDDILYCADAYFPRDILERHVIPYTYNPEKALETLEKLQGKTDLNLIPAHGGPGGEPEEDIQANIDAIKMVREKLLEIITSEKMLDEIAFKLFSELNIEIHGVGLYHLYLSIIRGYLTWLEDEEHIEPIIKEKKLLWRPIKK